MTNYDQQLIHDIATFTDLELEQFQSFEKMREKLAAFINDLVGNNFEKLIGLLYRIDVNETKLKMMIAQNTGTDAGYVIADAIINRQREKIKSRAQFSKKNDDIPEEERW